jgi:hypothetical protein
MAKKRRKDNNRRAEKGGGTADGGRGVTREAQDREGIPTVPACAPAALFIGLTVLLFRDFIFSDQMLFGSDTLGLGYVARAFYADVLTRLGMFPRWSPLILGGTPFLEALSSGDSLYPPSALLLMVMEPYRALGWKLVLHVAAAGFFMFGWIRSIGGSRPAATVSGTAYMLAPFFVTLVQPGHDGRMFVIALAPLLFWVVERHFQQASLKTFSAVAFVVAAVLFTTHFQMAYFLFGGVGMYALFRALQDRMSAPPRAHRLASAIPFALFLTASIAGAGIAAVQFVPAVQYVTEHSRRVQTTRDVAGETGAAWSSSWSMHPEEALGMVVPQFAGNNARGAPWADNTYWGRNGFKNNHEYAGLVLLLLAAVSFVGGRRRGLRLFFLGLGAVAFLFALGANTPVWRFFYEVVPGISLFRAPSQIIFLFGFSAATLGALGVDRILEVAAKDDREGWRRIIGVLGAGTAFVVVIALLASSGILTSLWTTVVYSDAGPQRAQLLDAFLPVVVQGAWTAFFFAAATLAAVWAFRKHLLAPTGLVVALVLLVGLDAFRIDAPFVEVMDFEAWATPDANTQAVLRTESGSSEPYRMLSFRHNGQDVMPAMHGIELVAGHHPNDLSRYRELIGMVGSGLPQNLQDPDIRRLLNVRYILWPDYQRGQSLQGSIFSRTQLQDGTPYETVLVEPDLPRARLVGGSVIKADNEAVQYMLSDAFNPESEVVLTEAAPIALDEEPAVGTVTWTERTPNRLRLEVTTERPALLVVSDNWFPAWKATVDDTDAPVLRAYHTLRAVAVPEGTHTVEMVYESDVVRASLWLSILLALGLVSATGYQMALEHRAGEAVV